MSRASIGANVSALPTRMPQRHTFKARCEQGRLAPIVIAAIVLALSCRILEGNVMFRNELHELSSRMESVMSAMTNRAM